MKFHCLLLCILIFVCLIVITKQQDVSSQTVDEYQEDEEEELSSDDIAEIMKEMEELAQTDADDVHSDEARSELNVGETTQQPSAPPTFASYSNNNKASDTESKKRSSIEYLRSKRKSAKKSSKKKAKQQTKGDTVNASGSATGGGAYYGGDIDREKKEAYNKQQQQRQQQQQQQSGQKSIRSSKMASTSNSRFQELESRLSENVRINMAYAEQQQAERDQERIARHTRFVIPRKYAAPVERIVTSYDDVHTDLYMVLDVSRTADEFALKKQYRTLALQIHPDKNPHPDAKAAFDAIQDAYDVLANPAKRKDYDKELSKLARARAWNSKKVWKYLLDMWENSKSQLLVSWYQFRRNEPIEEILVWKEKGIHLMNKFKYLVEHLVLLPSMSDRVMLINELWIKHKVLVLIAVIIMPSLTSMVI